MLRFYRSRLPFDLAYLSLFDSIPFDPIELDWIGSNRIEFCFYLQLDDFWFECTSSISTSFCQLFNLSSSLSDSFLTGSTGSILVYLLSLIVPDQTFFDSSLSLHTSSYLTFVSPFQYVESSHQCDHRSNFNLPIKSKFVRSGFANAKSDY